MKRKLLKFVRVGSLEMLEFKFIVKCSIQLIRVIFPFT